MASAPTKPAAVIACTQTAARGSLASYESSTYCCTVWYHVSASTDGCSNPGSGRAGKVPFLMRLAMSAFRFDGRAESESITCWHRAGACAVAGGWESAGGMAAGDPADDGAGVVGACAGAGATVVTDALSVERLSDVVPSAVAAVTTRRVGLHARRP